MLDLVKNIKEYFSSKEKKEGLIKAPKAMCPDCWGRNEYDGEYYEILRDKHLVSGGDRYDSFISKIVDKHVDNTHKHKDKYICTTCDKEI